MTTSHYKMWRRLRGLKPLPRGKMATDVTPSLQTPFETVPQRAIAPAWHTLILIAAMLTMSFTGAEHMAARSARPHGRLILYVATIILDWVIVGYIWMG